MEPNASTAPPAPDAPTRELTFGEKLVGVRFNPSADPKVDEAKVCMARAADLVHERMIEKGATTTQLDSMFAGLAFGDVTRASMAVVKLLTNRD